MKLTLATLIFTIVGFVAFIATAPTAIKIPANPVLVTEPVIITVNRHSNKIIRQSIPPGTPLDCNTPIYVEYH